MGGFPFNKNSGLKFRKFHVAGNVPIINWVMLTRQLSPEHQYRLNLNKNYEVNRR